MFQDPFDSLDPRQRVSCIVREPLSRLGLAGSRREAAERAAEAIEKVGLSTRLLGSVLLRGEIPSPIHLPAGCAFFSRCPAGEAACQAAVPSLQAVNDGSEHAVACLRTDARVALGIHHS